MSSAVAQYVVPSARTIPDETVRLVLDAINTGVAMPDNTRGITIGSGLIGYELEAPAKVIVPVITPLVNMIPRRQGTGIDQVHWKAITSFDTGHVVGALTNAAILPPAVTYSTASMVNIMASIALSNTVDFEAQWYGMSLEGDVRARRVAELLYQLKMLEERWVINASQLLMAPAAPVLSTATTGGSVTASTYSFCVTANNAQGETVAGAQSYITTTGATSTITVTIFTVWQATFYNVYAATGVVSGTPASTANLWQQTTLSGVGNAPQPGYNASVPLASGGSIPSGEIMGALVTLTLTAAVIGSATAHPPAVNGAKSNIDGGGNIKMWDGLLAQILNNTTSANGQTLQAFAGQPAAASGLLALADIDNMLEAMYSGAAGDPDFLIMHPVTHRKVTNLIVSSNSFRYVVDANQPADQARLTAQYRVGHYLNTATGKEIPIIPDRYCPMDTIVALPMSIPYPVPEITNAVELECNREYWGVDFAVVASQYSFADYVNHTLKLYFLGGAGTLRGILPSA
jgi:hypothetical protein